MVRTLTRSRALPKGRRTVLLPGATEAEPWEIWSVGADPQCVGMCRKPAESKSGPGTILALPVAQVFCLPLWLNETNAKEFRGMIELQLEARGLQARGQTPIFNSTVILQEAGRTLVLVAVLPALLPEELETESCQTFDVSARFVPLAPDALTLWREQDRLVIAVTRGERLAYFHALSDASLTPRAMQDLTCLIAVLQMQEVLGDLKKIVFWTEPSPAELAELKAAFSLPVRQESRPAPVAPAEPWNLTPLRVDEVKRIRASRRWQMRLGVLIILLLLLALGSFGVKLFLTAMEVKRLQHWKAEHADALQLVNGTEAAWKDLQPVVDENSYPLEILLHVSALVPTDQLHLTLFEAGAGHVLIKGEAKNLTAAFQLLDQLKKDPRLKGYTWQMAQPHSLANDVTQLQIEGTHATND